MNPPMNHKDAQLNREQEKALELLKSNENVFLTGCAGTGKSFLINIYRESLKNKTPILASTGAAAVLVKGRTFHSFFGLGIMKGGLESTVNNAAKNSRVKSNLKKAMEIIIDEISMISPEAFEAADRIAKKVLGNKSPMGGIRVIATGDFLQLPPINKQSAEPMPMLFNTPQWQELDFKTALLTQSMRASDLGFLKILNYVRHGEVNSEVEDFLNSKVSPLDENFKGTVLFSRRNKVEPYNDGKLNNLPGPVKEFPTRVEQKSKANKKTDEELIALSPLPQVLRLKPKALVMIRKNDPDFKFSNGSLGFVEKIHADEIDIRLLNNKLVVISEEEYEVLDAAGNLTAKIVNFPLTLAWATTIHKAQGASIDRIHVDLENLWEDGHAYVALSRAKSPEGLYIKGWKPSSIRANNAVVDFYKTIEQLNS